ncbi:MAG: (Fe-S)-binding protein [Gammaproteobacteria bacterium]|nr:(Fe-S)-binding protein [Gammaproteobacteria bacterium]
MSYSFDLNDSFAGFTPPTPPDGCTQCGICLSSCPTFAKSEDMEQSPMGRIRLMRSLENDSSEGMAPEKLDKLESCLGCYSCESVCPSRVNYGTLLDESLARLREQRPLPRITRMMLWLAYKTSFIRPIVQVTWLAQVMGLRTLLAKLGLLKLMGMQRANALLGEVVYPTRLTNRVQQPGQRVALFTGCFSSVMEQEIQQAAIDVFNALGLEVALPKGQCCCGALHRHNGEPETAGKLARNNIKAFSADQADAIITTSSGCGASLKKYGEWLEGEELATPVMDVSHYLANALRQHKLEFDHLPLKVAVHTPCTLRPGEDQEEAVAELLQKIPGLEIVPLSGAPRCCGAGGSQILSQPQMADALRDDIVDEIRATGAEILISSNLGCAMHLREGLAQAGIDIPLQHPVQLISQAMVRDECVWTN